MLTLKQTAESPFCYSVKGEPGVNDRKVDVTFTASVHRYASGPVHGPNTLFNTGEGTRVYQQEARWLAEQGVASIGA
jgi:hypothetical protein